MQRPPEVLQRALHFGGAHRVAGPGRVVEPRHHRVERGLVVGEEGFALGRDRVLLAFALLGADLRVAEFGEQGQRRVDHSGARAVVAADALFDRLDHFVAVTRPLRQQRQHDEAQIALREQALPRA